MCGCRLFSKLVESKWHGRQMQKTGSSWKLKTTREGRVDFARISYGTYYYNNAKGCGRVPGTNRKRGIFYMTGTRLTHTRCAQGLADIIIDHGDLLPSASNFFQARDYI